MIVHIAVRTVAVLRNLYIYAHGSIDHRSDLVVAPIIPASNGIHSINLCLRHTRAQNQGQIEGLDGTCVVLLL